MVVTKLVNIRLNTSIHMFFPANGIHDLLFETLMGTKCQNMTHTLEQENWMVESCSILSIGKHMQIFDSNGPFIYSFIHSFIFSSVRQMIYHLLPFRNGMTNVVWFHIWLILVATIYKNGEIPFGNIFFCLNSIGVCRSIGRTEHCFYEHSWSKYVKSLVNCRHYGFPLSNMLIYHLES